MKISFAFLFLCGTLFGQTPRQPFFLSPAQLDVASFLAGPPAADGWQTRMEIAELHRLQETRTDAEIARAMADDTQEDIFVFRGVVGPALERGNLPQTALLSDHLHSDESLIDAKPKRFFHRVRPYKFDTTLRPVCKTKTDPADFAYPSGHSTTGYMEGFVLAMMLPEKREAILARADDYAHNRLVCGVHYPADIVASKEVAYAAMGVILQNAQFRREFEAARAEVRKALGLPEISNF